MIRHWLPLAVVITGLCGLVYGVSQQVLRLDANDPQIQVAEDTASRLSAGVPLASVLTSGTLDVGQSLGLFTIVYDEQGQVLAATGLLNGQPPAMPSGVFDSVRQKGEDRISWQPQPAARY